MTFGIVKNHTCIRRIDDGIFSTTPGSRICHDGDVPVNNDAMLVVGPRVQDDGIAGPCTSDLVLDRIAGIDCMPGRYYRSSTASGWRGGFL